MDDEVLLHAVSQALIAHGVDSRIEAGRVIAKELLFFVDARLHAEHPNSVIFQVAFGTQTPGLQERVIWNAFAGVGPDARSAKLNAFEKFLLGPFHVLLSALTSHQCEQGGEAWSERRDASGRSWRVCDSALVTQGFSDPASVPFPPVQEALVRAAIDDVEFAIHWVEAFFAFLDGKLSTLDVQRDGVPWPAGVQMISDWTFRPDGAEYRSGRYFFIALPGGD